MKRINVLFLSQIALWAFGCNVLAPANQAPACSTDKQATLSASEGAGAAIADLCSDHEESFYISEVTRLQSLGKTIGDCESAKAGFSTPEEESTFCDNPDSWGVCSADGSGGCGHQAVWEITAVEKSSSGVAYAALTNNAATYSSSATYSANGSVSFSETPADFEMNQQNYLLAIRNKLYLSKTACTPNTPFTVTFKYYDYQGSSATGSVAVSCPDCVAEATCDDQCSSNSECSSGLYCSNSGSCVECTSNDHCTSGKVCSSNACVASTTTAETGGNAETGNQTAEASLSTSFSISAFSPNYLTVPSGGCAATTSCSVSFVTDASSTSLTFTAGSVTGGSAPYVYAWAVGDGSFTTGEANFVRSGFLFGANTIRLRVTDSNNLSVTVSKTINLSYE